jgi:hypothetical protein
MKIWATPVGKENWVVDSGLVKTNCKAGQELPLTEEAEIGFHNLNLKKSILEGKVVSFGEFPLFSGDCKMKGWLMMV